METLLQRYAGKLLFVSIITGNLLILKESPSTLAACSGVVEGLKDYLL